MAAVIAVGDWTAQIGHTMLQTESGVLSLVPPNDEFLRDLRVAWPFGYAVGEMNGQCVVALGLQRGEIEVPLFKIQQVEQPEREARGWMVINSVRLAAGLATYIQQPRSGVLVCGVYMKQKPAGFETGVVIWPASIPYDDNACARLSVDLLQTMRGLAGFPKPPVIGLDHRVRSQVGMVQLLFLAVGQKLACLKTTLPDKSPVWDTCVEHGIAEMVHLPCAPATLPGAAQQGESRLHLPPLPPQFAKDE